MKAVRSYCAYALIAAFGAAVLSAAGAALAAEDEIITYRGIAPVEFDNYFIMDVRDENACQKASLPGARCLSASDILAPHRRLPNMDGLLWLLGTIGLGGKEHVLIVGNRKRDMDFAAGMLYVAGQRRISVLTAPVSRLKGGVFEPGETRSKTRERVFQAPMRDNALILREELARKIRDNTPLVILDLRNESEYWGQKLRSIRGGHIPGAVLMSENAFLSGKAGLQSVNITAGTGMVIYGHGTYEGIAALARLVAGGLRPMVLFGGWAGWALDGSLPADAATYANVLINPNGSESKSLKPDAPKLRFLVIGVIIAAGAFGSGYLTKWLTTGKGK